MYLAKGTGIFFKLGRTIAFHNRTSMTSGNRNESFGGLRQRKYDSLQFTHTQENGIFKYEIIDLRQHQPYNHSHCSHCGTTCPQTAPGIYRRGWSASAACTCVADTACLRCEGMGPRVDDVVFATSSYHSPHLAPQTVAT